MNALSWIVLGLLAVWFAYALWRMIRNRGRFCCGRAGEKDGSPCSGCCSSCPHHGHCKK